MKKRYINKELSEQDQMEQFISEVAYFVGNVEKRDKMILYTPDARYTIEVKKVVGSYENGM